MSIIKKSIVGVALTASALVSTASPVLARDYYRQRDNTAAVATGVGIIGLAVGAIAASSNDNRRYREDRYYGRDAQVRNDQFYRNDDYDRSRSTQRRGWDDRGGFDNDRRSGWDDGYYSRRGY
jgi:hypothetical protein